VAVDGGSRFGVQVVKEQSGLGLAQRLELEPAHPGTGQGGVQALGDLPRPEAKRQQNGRVGSAAGKRRDQLDRGGVAPVKVVQHEHQRLVLGHKAQ
jgi:hypothetical protein